MKTAMQILTLLAFAGMSTPVMSDIWPGLKEELYGSRSIHDGSDLIDIDAPYRSPNDARTDIAAQVVAPHGLKIGRVTVVLDNNPMPVSAVFALDTPQPSFFFDVTMRVNGPTPLHVVAETTDGQLFMAETYVKTSGLGACAAPPGTDPKLALATLGQMRVNLSDALVDASARQLSTLTNRTKWVELDISHPSHSGMQMDQISLLFIPMRYVESIEIDLDGVGYVDVTGSISLSENPHLAFSVPMETRSIDVTMADTDGTISHMNKHLGGF